MLEIETKVQRYERYIDSGVEWLGEVPKHWDLTRLGTRFKERKTKVSDKDFPPLSVTKNGTVPQLANAAKSNDGENRKLVKKGDFAINSRSDRKGSSGIAYQDGSVSLIYIVMEPLNIHPIYCNYLLKSYNFIEEFYRMGHGIVADLWTTRYDEMKVIMVGIPPLQEQTAIAQFLDDKTTKIDEAIAIKVQQINLLKERKQILIHKAVTRGLNPNVKLKDSGIDWIGEIPGHWEIKPIKYIKANIKNAFVDGPFGSNLKSEHFIENGEVYVVESGFITTGVFINKKFKTISEKHFKTIIRSECKKADVIIAKIGANYGMAAELPELKKRSVVSGNSLKITLNNEMILNILFVKLLGLAKHLGGFEDIVNASAQPALSLGGLNKLLLPIAPLLEQREISAYIETASKKIERAISLKQQEIAKLKEYKSSLINSVVTGKVKVC
jgi:type I restriction enzyme S subunit